MRLLTVTAVALIGIVCGIAGAEDKASPGKLKDAMTMMKEKAAALGAPKAEGVSLFFGTTKLNGNYEIVDTVKEKHGAVATFFVKKDDSFIRVSTNVQKEGNRAVGTKLDPAGKPYAAVLKGESYEGEADILGGKYDTTYVPIKNDKNEVVGVYFVGIAK
jgi:hypothetical protein